MLKKSNVAGKDFDKISKKIQFLARNNRLNANNFTFADNIAKAYDSFIGASDIFSRADASNLVLKAMPGNSLRGRSITLGAAEGILPSITDYLTKLGMVSDPTQARNQEELDSARNKLGSDVIKDYTGINLQDRAASLANMARQRYKNLSSIPGILTRNIKAERGRREENKNGDLGQNSLNIGGSSGFVGFPTFDKESAIGAFLKPGQLFKGEDPRRTTRCGIHEEPQQGKYSGL